MSQAAGRAVHVERRGGPEQLQLTDREFADAAPGMVRIVMEAAGVAYGDLLLREGMVTGAPPHPIPGYDSIGVVDSVGAGVTGISIGDRVALRTDGTGAYSTHVEGSAAYVVPVPQGVRAHQAVALVLNYVTAWQMLTRVAPVGEGGTIVVHGAAGGVGSALAELGRLRGLIVLGTASESRREGLESRGVRAFDRLSWTREIAAAVPHGVDAVFEGVGGGTSRRSLALLGPGGQLVSYGVSSILANGRRSVRGLVGAIARPARASSFDLFRRGIGMNGYLSASYVPAHPDWFRRDLSTLLGLLEDGAIAPVIAAEFPLSHAAQAHRAIASGATGKVVLVP